MSHDVFICYDEEDKDCAEAICRIFEENNIKTWIRSRDVSSKDAARNLTEAIRNSKCFVLVYSKNGKNTNYIINETDIAFSKEIPIILFKLDETSIPKDLEFILISKKKIVAYPHSKRQLKTLVKETSEIIDKPIDNIELNSKSVKTIERSNPKRKENNIKKAIGAAALIAAVLILIYLFVIVPTGQNITDSGVFSMDVTHVEVDELAKGNKYTIYGESYNLPSDSDRYFMNLQFFDDKDNVVYEVNSTADEFKSGIIWSGDIDKGDIKHIGFKLTDMDNKILSQEDYNLGF